MQADSSTIGRVLTLIRVLDESAPDPVSLADLTSRTGIPKSSVRRLAETLVVHGVLSRDAQGYGFGDESGPVLRRLRPATRERRTLRSHLTDALRNTRADCVWLIDVSDPRRFRLIDMVGRPGAILGVAGRDWPGGLDDPAALASALGRLALSGLPTEIDRRCSRGLARSTPHTVTEPVRVAEKVKQAGVNGYEVESEEFRLGWSCVTVAVRSADAAPLILGAVGEVDDFDTDVALQALVASRDILRSHDDLP